MRKLLGRDYVKFLVFILVSVLILYIMLERKGAPDRAPIKFAYITRSREDKSYSDIYNEELIRYFSRVSNARVEIIKGSYDELRERKGEIDVFIDYPLNMKSDKRIELINKRRYTVYADEVFPLGEVTVGKTIALFKGDNLFFRNLTTRNAENDYIFVDSMEEGFELLKEKRVDGFFTLEDPIYMRNPRRRSIEKINVFGDYSYPKTFSIMREEREIEDKIGKFIKWFKVKDMIRLDQRAESRLIWSQVNLSPEEAEYIKNKRVIRVGTNFDRISPLAYWENKELMGSISEYMDLLRKGTGIRVEYVQQPGAYRSGEALERGLIDLDPLHIHHSETHELAETLPYFDTMVGIFGLEGEWGRNIEEAFSGYDLTKGPIGVKLDGSRERNDFISKVNIEGYYEALKTGEIDYFSHLYATVKTPNNLEGIKDLRLYEVLDKKIYVSMAAREENRIIIDILNRMFEYLDHDEIRYKWEMASNNVEGKGDYRKFVFIMGVILIFLLPYILILKIEMVKIKRMEKELQETKENLENALNIKSAFLANMSHEMRTPLTAILGFNKLLVRKEEDEKKRELMENVGVAAHNLLDFINNVLDLSKLESGRVELKYKRINLGQMADELERISLGLKRSDDVEFCFIITEKAPKYFMGDEVWLKEIILNLLGNAFKFTEKGSVQLFITSEEDELIIEVRDTGIGMKNFEEEKENIFKRFEQLDLNENRDKKGSGLGLAIVKEVVELMEGSISVKSIFKAGTTFRITLPIKKKLELPGMIRGIRSQGREADEGEGA